MKRMIHILAIIGSLSLSGMATNIEARSQFQDSFTADQARDARKQGKVLGAGQVMRIVQRQYPRLKAADARLSSKGSQGPRYYVKMLSSDGRVVEVIVNARTGRILGTRGN